MKIVGPVSGEFRLLALAERRDQRRDGAHLAPLVAARARCGRSAASRASSGHRIVQQRQQTVEVRCQRVVCGASRRRVRDEPAQPRGRLPCFRHALHVGRARGGIGADRIAPGARFGREHRGAQFGGVISDNLAFYIMKTTGAGFVIDGAIRDIDGLREFGDLVGYYRAAVPPAIHDLMVTGINVPIRIGTATVMPGDVVFGDPEGVYFIPPSQVQALVDEADVTHIHDEWTKKKFDEGKYISTDIYGSPHEPALIQEYQDYLKSKMGAQRYDEYTKRRAQAPAGGRGAGQGGGRGAGGGRGQQP